MSQTCEYVSFSEEISKITEEMSIQKLNNATYDIPRSKTLMNSTKARKIALNPQMNKSELKSFYKKEFDKLAETNLKNILDFEKYDTSVISKSKIYNTHRNSELYESRINNSKINIRGSEISPCIIEDHKIIQRGYNVMKDKRKSLFFLVYQKI